MIYRSINLRWTGHSGFFIQTADKKNIYIDPYKLKGDQWDFDKADYILITHSHFDHCSIEDIQKIVRDGTILICPADVSSKMRHIDRKVDIKLAEIGEKISFDDGRINVWPVPAYNLNKTFHELDEGWVGYILESDGVYVYHAGDTDLIPEMKQFRNIDIALLPIGGTYTMNAGEAAKAACLIKPQLAIPMHYNFISGSGTSIGSKSDAEVFQKYCSAEGIEVKIL